MKRIGYLLCSWRRDRGILPGGTLFRAGGVGRACTRGAADATQGSPASLGGGTIVGIINGRFWGSIW